MDREKLKLLRNKIAIPLKEAIELLKENNGDIKASETAFHQKKIEEICVITEDEEQLVKQYYRKFNHDKEKVIRKLCERQLIFTIKETSVPKNSIGFIFWYEQENGEQYKTLNRNSAFIPTEDFDYILEEFKSACTENFDRTGFNYFDKVTTLKIIEGINTISKHDPKLKEFLNELNKWILEKMAYAHRLVVYGNL